MREFIAALGLVLVLGGCAEPERPELAYLPPSTLPPAARNAIVAQPPSLVWGNVLDRLQQEGLEVEFLEVDALGERGGQLVVAYRGDPQHYLDCGWIAVYARDAFERIPAAVRESEFARRRGGRTVPVQRDLVLEARMTVEVEPAGEDSKVSAEATYVVTKSSRLAEQSNDAPPLHAEAISFRTGERAEFASGTTCQPNGRLERLVFDALPAISVAGG